MSTVTHWNCCCSSCTRYYNATQFKDGAAVGAASDSMWPSYSTSPPCPEDSLLQLFAGMPSPTGGGGPDEYPSAPECLWGTINYRVGSFFYPSNGWMYQPAGGGDAYTVKAAPMDSPIFHQTFVAPTATTDEKGRPLSAAASAACPKNVPGAKVVKSWKYWQGRIGFTDDPAAANTRYLSVSTVASVSAQSNSSYDGVWDDGSHVHYKAQSGNAGNYSCVSASDHFGHVTNSGSINAPPGNASATSDDTRGSPYNGPICYGSNPMTFGDPLPVPAWDSYCTPDPAVGVETAGLMRAFVADATYTDAYMGQVQIRVPWLTTPHYSPSAGSPATWGNFNGNPGAFASWLASHDVNTTDTHTADDGMGGTNTFTNTEVFTVSGSCSLTNTSLFYKIGYSYTLNKSVSGPTGTTTWAVAWTGTITVSVQLGNPYTIGQVAEEAKALLNYWDLTDDVQYPWRTDSGLHTCPYVTYREASTGGPQNGWCGDNPNPSDLQSDGSVLGKPLPNGFYVLGFYDFNYIDWTHSVEYGDTYTYGMFCPGTANGAPTTMTQWTPSRGIWCVDSRNNYAPIPRSAYLVSMGAPGWSICGVGAAKWAEKKCAVPSENWFGPCGARRKAVLTLDSVCNTIAPTPRWSFAWPCCGKISVVSAVQSGANVVITLSAPIWPINGDLLDFTGVAGLGSGATVTGLAYSGVSNIPDAGVTTFSVVGTLSGSYTGGGFVQSHNAPDPSWNTSATRGDYVRVTALNGALSAVQDNVKTGTVIAILPPGSPEIGNPKWANPKIYTDYPGADLNTMWYSRIIQTMNDRYYHPIQDGSKSSGGFPASCIPDPDKPPPPQVEAVLGPPAGAPYTFTTTGSDMPVPSTAADYNQFLFWCLTWTSYDAWNVTPAMSSISSGSGNLSTSPDTGTTSDITGGLGSADQTYIL